MSDYSQITFFTSKDGLNTGNPAKVIKGSEHDGEFAAISTAIATKYDAVTNGLTATGNSLALTAADLAEMAATADNDRILSADVSVGGTYTVEYTTPADIVTSAFDTVGALLADDTVGIAWNATTDNLELSIDTLTQIVREKQDWVAVNDSTDNSTKKVKIDDLSDRPIKDMPTATVFDNDDYLVYGNISSAEEPSKITFSNFWADLGAQIAISGTDGLSGGGTIAASRNITVNEAYDFTWTGGQVMDTIVQIGVDGSASERYLLFNSDSTTSNTVMGQVAGSGFYIQNAQNAEAYIKCVPNAGVTLYYNGVATFWTYSGGVGAAVINASTDFVCNSRFLNTDEYRVLAHGHISGMATPSLSNSHGVSSVTAGDQIYERKVNLSESVSSSDHLHIYATGHGVGGEGCYIKSESIDTNTIQFIALTDAGGDYKDLNFIVIAVERD